MASASSFAALVLEHICRIPDHPDLSNEQCAICLNSYNASHPAIQVNNMNGCTHVFGRNCLIAYIDRRSRSTGTCPVCRRVWYVPVVEGPAASAPRHRAHDEDRASNVQGPAQRQGELRNHVEEISRMARGRVEERMGARMRESQLTAAREGNGELWRGASAAGAAVMEQGREEQSGSDHGSDRGTESSGEYIQFPSSWVWRGGRWVALG